MAFWGAIVPDDEPYTLRLEGDHKRVCITQATLGDYIGRYWTTSCSKLKCAVGSKPPVYICALSKERPFTRLNLEFDESQEVVFSIRGPQGIHLTGHYAPPKAAAKKDKSTAIDDLPIDCSVEEKIVVAENEEPKESTAVEDAGHTDSLADGDERNLVKEDKLENAELHIDVNAKTAEEQQEIICAYDTEPQNGGDEYYVSCIRKTLTTANKKLEKVDKVTIGPDSKVENAGTVDKETEENTDANGEASLPSDCLLPQNEMDMNKGTEPGKISSEHFVKEGASDSNAYATDIKDDEVEQEDSNKNSFQSLITIVGEAKGQVLNCEIGGLHPSQPTSVIEDVVQKPVQTLKNCGVQAMLTTTNTCKPANYQTNSNEASEEERFDGNLVDSGNKVNVSCVKSVEEQMPSSAKVAWDPYPGEGNYRHSLKEDKARQDVKGNENVLTMLPKNSGDCKPIDELAEEEHLRTKQQKKEASETETNVFIMPHEGRILSNGMIIEDVAIGKCNGKEAAPGRKVKIFYTARIRDTGASVETNVGENPLKFRLGDKRIIPGLNIGIDGMRIEGRRRLFIPPIGYGEKVKAHLPPNAWLVYDIELVGVKSCRKRKRG